MKNSIFFLLCLSALFIASCNKDDGHEEHGTEVTFKSPTDGTTIALADAASVSINIDFSSEEELHEVEVSLTADSAPSDKIIDFDEHQHESTYSFEQVVDLSSYGSGASFTLTTVVCADHDCESTEEHSISFSIE